jgi:hypothetical protein
VAVAAAGYLPTAPTPLQGTQLRILGRRRRRRHPGRASRRGSGAPAPAANHHRHALAGLADDLSMVRAAREILRPNRHLPGAMAAGAGAAMNWSRKPLAALASSPSSPQRFSSPPSPTRAAEVAEATGTGRIIAQSAPATATAGSPAARRPG